MMEGMEQNPYQSPHSCRPTGGSIASTTFGLRPAKCFLRKLGLQVCYTNLALFCLWAWIVGSYMATGLELLPVLQNNYVLGCWGGLLILGGLLGLTLVGTGLLADLLRRCV